MFGIPDCPTFVVAIAVFLFIPGPGNRVVLSGAGQGGVRGGLFLVVLGILAGGGAETGLRERVAS